MGCGVACGNQCLADDLTQIVYAQSRGGKSVQGAEIMHFSVAVEKGVRNGAVLASADDLPMVVDP